jgi:hypothetical protein
VVQFVKDDGKIRLALKELPIFGDESVATAKLARFVTSGSYSLTGRTEVGRLSTQFLKGVI